MLSCRSVGYVCVRYPTDVGHCIVKKVYFVPLAVVVHYYGGWMDGRMVYYYKGETEGDV